MSVIEAQQLMLKVGSKHILKDINLKIEEGERWVLFGLNGSGKTTLLSILAGYLSPSEGDFLLFGQTPVADNIASLRKVIGWVSTSFYDRYLREESIMDIVLGGKQGSLGISEEDIEDSDVRRAKYLLTQLGLKRQMRYNYDMLSRGQKQKVLLARAMMSECRLIIMDESCSGLDILSKAKVLYELEKLLHDEKKTLIYVAHHTEEILPFFDKAMLLKNGQIHSQGEIDDIFSNKNLSDFLQLPVDVERTQDILSVKIHVEEIDLSRY